MTNHILPNNKSMYIPKYWLSDHNPIGEKFKVPGDDEIYFIALKSPLSEALNNLLPQEKRWGPKEVMKKIQSKLGQESITNWIFTAIELSDKVEPPADEWDKLRVENHYRPISHDYLKSEIDSFINLIKPNSGTSYKNLYMVSCNNGHDRCGAAISRYLMQNYELKISQAYSLFKKNRWPGIYSKVATDFLSSYLKKDEKPIYCAREKDEFIIQNKHDEISDLKLSVERTSDFKHYFCKSISSQTMISNCNDHLNNATLDESFIHFPESDSPNPILDFLEFDDTKELNLTPECLKTIQKHAYRCSFVPSGVFLYLMAFESNCLIINYGFNNYWSIDCHVKCKLPFICTAYAVEAPKYLEIYITDLLSYQNETLEKVDLDDRITTIYYDILPNISLSKRVDVRLRYRPMGRMTDLVKLYDFLKLEDTKYKYNFRPAGLAFMRRSWPPGRSIFVPLITEVHLLFLLNATDIAVLYARSDDNKTILPVKYFEIPKKEKFGELHDKVIKFSIQEPKNPLSYWKPISVCKNRLPDFISYVKAIDNSIITEKNATKVLKTLEDTVKKGLEEQKKQKNKQKGSKK